MKAYYTMATHILDPVTSKLLSQTMVRHVLSPILWIQTQNGHSLYQSYIEGNVSGNNI